MPSTDTPKRKKSKHTPQTDDDDTVRYGTLTDSEPATTQVATPSIMLQYAQRLLDALNESDIKIRAEKVQSLTDEFAQLQPPTNQPCDATSFNAINDVLNSVETVQVQLQRQGKGQSSTQRTSTPSFIPSTLSALAIWSRLSLAFLACAASSLAAAASSSVSPSGFASQPPPSSTVAKVDASFTSLFLGDCTRFLSADLSAIRAAEEELQTSTGRLLPLFLESIKVGVCGLPLFTGQQQHPNQSSRLALRDQELYLAHRCGRSEKRTREAIRKFLADYQPPHSTTAVSTKPTVASTTEREEQDDDAAQMVTETPSAITSTPSKSKSKSTSQSNKKQQEEVDESAAPGPAPATPAPTKHETSTSAHSEKKKCKFKLKSSSKRPRE